MLKSLFSCGLGVALGLGFARAQVIDYTVTGVFGSDTTTSAFAAAGDSFSLKFSLPAVQDTSEFTESFDVAAPELTYSLAGTTLFNSAGTASFGHGLGSPSSSLEISFISGGNFLDFQFSTTQPNPLFNGAISTTVTLIPASFDPIVASFSEGSNFSTIDSSLVQATDTPVPEPGVPALLLIGTLALGYYSVRRQRRANT